MANLKEKLFGASAAAMLMASATPALAQQAASAASANPTNNTTVSVNPVSSNANSNNAAAQAAAAAEAKAAADAQAAAAAKAEQTQQQSASSNQGQSQAQDTKQANEQSTTYKAPNLVFGVGIDATSLAKFVFNGEQLGQVCRVNGDVAAGKDPMLSGPKAVTLKVQGGDKGEKATTFVCQQTALLAFAREEMRAGRLRGNDAIQLIAAITGGTVVVNNNTQGVAAQPAVPFTAPAMDQIRALPVPAAAPAAKPYKARKVQAKVHLAPAKPAAKPCPPVKTTKLAPGK